MKEKNKIIMHRIVWLCITLILILNPIILSISKSNTNKTDLEIVDTSVTSEYVSLLNCSDVKVTLTFNTKVNNGYVDIIFYGSDGKLLTQKNIYLYSYGKIAENNSYIYEGEVKSYKIVSTNFTASTNDSDYFMIIIISLPFIVASILMFISTLLLSYKEYIVDGRIISVYAGFYHHTLRINGEKCDEHNTIISYTPIKLSTTLENGSKIEATISLTNRISTKLNDRIIIN